MTPLELKAALMSLAEAEIEKLVKWEGKTAKMTLTDLEDEMLESRQRLYIELSEVVLAQQEARRNADIPVNERTGAHYITSQRQKKKEVITRVGCLSYERQYYYDKADRQGCYPLDEQLKVEQEISNGMSRLMVKLSADRSFQSSADIVSELIRVSVSDSSVWRETQKAGEKVERDRQVKALFR